MKRTLTLIFVVSSFLAASAAWGQGVVRVPQDADLRQALDRVANGGAIVIAAGTYTTPETGLRVRPRGRSFTLRAAPGAEVVFDGQGATTLIDLQDAAAGEGRVITFENLIFRDGFTTRESRGGAVTVMRAEAVFVGCRFESNRSEAPTTGGGGVRVGDAARVTFLGSIWDGNSARNRGGALETIDSTVRIFTSRFTGNRVNLPPDHRPTSPGGAIYVLDSHLTVDTTRFEGNEAGWVGGAIFAFGTWREPESVPSTEVDVVNSTFVGNRSQGDPCCAVSPPTFGGALHAEDQVTMRVEGSRFFGNEAHRGGAIDTYRAILEIRGSELRGNRAVEDGTTFGAGGALFISSSDFADATTDFGAVNRRSAELTVEDTLFQGRFGGVEEAANQGGCLFAAGDVTRINGTGGVEKDGTLEQNQARVELSRVVLADCDVTTHPSARGNGGGAMTQAVDLTMVDSLVIDSDAEDGGGGLAEFGNSSLSFRRTTFAGNRAEFGGGLMVLGSSLSVDASQFLANAVPASPVQLSRGAAIYASPLFPAGQPERHRDVTGVVRNSLFANHEGLAILDIDRHGGPINDMRYDGNRFRETTFGNVIYRDNLEGPAGDSVGGLNSLVVVRSNGSRTDKSTSANQQLGGNPRAGALVAAPPAVLGALPPGDPQPPAAAWLGYASTRSSPRLEGQSLAGTTGLTEVAEPGAYRLEVGGTRVATTTVGETFCPGSRSLCAQRGRFRVEVAFRARFGGGGAGQAVPGGTDDSGLFFFFDPDNWEMLVKVLDGCVINRHFWVFAAATTNVEYTLTVTDTLTGDVASYFNPLGNAAAAITDNRALRTCDAAAVVEPDGFAAGLALTEVPEAGPGAARTERRLAARPRAARSSTARSAPGPGLPTTPEPFAAAGQEGTCAAGPEALCLNRGRFRVEVEFEDQFGGSGSGKVVPFGTDDSGLFFFFAEDNWEMLVKVLNGCPINQRFWVFSAATTNVGYTLRVTDTETGKAQVYVNPLGVSAPAITDTLSFDVCP